MPRTCPYRIELSSGERARLEATARRYTSPYRDVIRAKIVLYAAAGLDSDDLAARLNTPRRIVSKWRKRFFREPHERLGGTIPHRAPIARPSLRMIFVPSANSSSAC